MDRGAQCRLFAGLAPRFCGREVQQLGDQQRYELIVDFVDDNAAAIFITFKNVIGPVAISIDEIRALALAKHGEIEISDPRDIRRVILKDTVKF
jgi:hypothetical protein